MEASIVDNIRLIRKSKDLSQEFMAKKLNITQQAYSLMEKNPDMITLKRLKDLCKILEVNLLTLLGEDNVYVKQNYNTNSKNAATTTTSNADTNQEIEVYQLYVSSLKEEIAHYRKIQENLRLKK